ncbi:MAG TPA: glycosyltransferase, partial [Planctomycetota bacterium]|nr:glycosyltransferase [Planctomycetota bacterium]
ELARELARRGHEIVIVATERDLARKDGDVREREHRGLRVLEVAHSREYACAEETWEEPRQGVIFAALLEQERPDVLHVQHFAQWGSAVLEVAAKARIPALVTLHDYYLLCANACLLRADGALCAGDCSQCLQSLPSRRPTTASLDDAADARRARHRQHLRHARCVIAPSRFLASRMIERRMVAAEQIQVLGSGVEGPWREPRASDPSVPLRLAYIGGIYPTKGVHVLVEAFRKLPPGTATLDVHGVLEWFPTYVGHLRRQLGARDDVRWHGRFEPETLDALLAEADLLVVPSLWYENRPLTIQAAFRCGVPVLASDQGGMAELVVPGHGGLLFETGDATALASRIVTLAADRAQLLALARARPKLPSLAEVADRHEELYAAAAAGNQPFF